MFGFFSYPALTTPARELFVVQPMEGLAPVDTVVYFGSQEADPPAAGLSGSLVFTVMSAGDGAPVTDISLARTQAGLDTATPGAPLALAGSIQAGIDAAIAIWIRVSDQSGLVGIKRNLSIRVEVKA